MVDGKISHDKETTDSVALNERNRNCVVETN